MINAGSTVQRAKEWLRSRLKDGERCPVCNQWAQAYRRKLNRTMARQLLLIAKESSANDGPVHAQNIMRAAGEPSGDYGKLRFWDVLRTTSPGRWELTECGKQWLRGDIKLPRFAIVYNDRCLRLEGEPTSFSDALGAPFDLEELRRGLEARP